MNAPLSQAKLQHLDTSRTPSAFRESNEVQRQKWGVQPRARRLAVHKSFLRAGLFRQRNDLMSRWERGFACSTEIWARADMRKRSAENYCAPVRDWSQQLSKRRWWGVSAPPLHGSSHRSRWAAEPTACSLAGNLACALRGGSPLGPASTR